MTLRRRIGTRRTMSALAGVVAGITLPAMVFVMPVLAGESAQGGAWNIASWANGLPSVDLPKPGNEMPAIGTILTGGGSKSVASENAHKPSSAVLGVPAIKQVKSLQDSVTDEQHKQIVAVLDKYAPQVKGAAESLPKPSLDAPSSKMSAADIKAPPAPDAAKLAAASASLRSITSKMNDEIKAILTPDQRAAFDKTVPDPTLVDSLPLPSTATVKAASSDDSNESVSVQASKDNSDKEVKRTQTEKQQKDRTNSAGLDQYHTEGNIIGLRCTADQPVPDVIHGPVSFNVNETPYAVLGTKDGLQQVRLINDTSSECGQLHTGDYLSVDGEKQHEFLFDAEQMVSEPSVLR